MNDSTLSIMVRTLCLLQKIKVMKAGTCFLASSTEEEKQKRRCHFLIDFGCVLQLYKRCDTQTIVEYLLLTVAPFRSRHSGSSASVSLFSSSNLLHLLILYIHESPLWSSLFTPAWQHPLSNKATIPSLHLPKPSQPCLSHFVSKQLYLSCLFDILISDPVPPDC